MKHLVAILMLLGAMSVCAADEPTREMSLNEFTQFMEGYYKHPQPERVDSAIRFLAGPGAGFMNENTRQMQTMFACLFKRHPERRDEWKKTIASLPDEPRARFQVSMESSIEAMFLDTPTVPEKNDMSWGCFLVTGDTDYVQDVIAAMKHLDERKDLYVFLTGATAQWSLASLATSDDRVRARLEAAAKGTDPQIAAAAQVALTKPAGEIRATTVEILKQQKDAGVWQ